ncbi:MAG: porin family protein [Flavobacteriales bacterium]
MIRSIGGVAGAYFPLDCGMRFEIQPELLVSAQGAALTYGENGRREMRMLYVQLPIIAKVFLSNVLNVQGGVQGGMLLAATEDGGNVKERYRTTDASLAIGLGVDMTSGWDMTFRYTSGLTSILVSDKAIYPTNRTMQASLGYRFLHFSHQRMRYRHR